MSRKLFTLSLIALVMLLGATGAMAQDQVLRIATGSSGVANFSFQILSAGGDQQNWITFQSVPPLYFDVDSNLHTGYFNSWAQNEDSTVWTFTVDRMLAGPMALESLRSRSLIPGRFKPRRLNSVGRIRTYLGNVAGFADAREMGAVDAMTVDVLVCRRLMTRPCRLSWYCRIRSSSGASPRRIWQSPAPRTSWSTASTNSGSGKQSDRQRPFILTSFDADLQTAEMTPNPEWWKEGPILEKVVFMFVTDQQIVARWR